MASQSTTEDSLVADLQKLSLKHPKYTLEDSTLIADLHRLSAKNPKLVKSSTYTAPADPGITLRSWKMNEFKYYDVPSPFPTLARGLFTTELPGEGDAEKRYRIVVRGYDKFFNIGEVPWTNWASLAARTAPPYTLTLKSNGCIIFIGALTPTKLIVTSKHSLGPGGDQEKSHAVWGERWLRKHLEAKGKTEEELAGRLWDMNWTAIAELCDDNFEEHVLSYPPSQTGLHLHGLNTCTKAFQTLPPSAVDAFAAEWGFIKTKSVEMHSVDEVKSFTEETGKTGTWNGEPIEGFVVRTHVVEPPRGEGRASASPYPPDSTFFFKVKFDEPYMMYRDWREITKKLLTAHSKSTAPRSLDQVSIPKNKLKRPETQVYVKWVKEEIKRDPGAFAEYSRGKGIVATRERFLRWLQGEEGKKGLVGTGEEAAVEQAGKGEGEEASEFRKTIIVPVAVPGCGKTSVSVAIARLFGFGHTQSDDVKVKKAARAFIKNVADLLRTHDVVIADKNNHLQDHRTQLRDLANTFHPPARLLALDWIEEISSTPRSTIHRMLSDRVLARGANHQSLVADPDNPDATFHEEVIRKFLDTVDELQPAEVDEVVEMRIGEGMEEAVGRAVEGCVAVLGVKRPSEAELGEAVGVARGYEPKTKKIAGVGDSEAKVPRYFAFSPEIDLDDILRPKLTFLPTEPDTSSSFWADLQENNRVTRRPHVTVVHKNSLPDEQDLWERCRALYRMRSPPLFKFKLGHVVWNARVMAITVDDVELATITTTTTTGVTTTAPLLPSSTPSRLGQEFVSLLPDDVKGRLHITVGTRDKGVLPVEAKSLVETWRSRGMKDGDGVRSVELGDADAVARLEGLFS